jgi:methyl-accepting chemotaxis protein
VHVSDIERVAVKGITAQKCESDDDGVVVNRRLVSVSRIVWTVGHSVDADTVISREIADYDFDFSGQLKERATSSRETAPSMAQLTTTENLDACSARVIHAWANSPTDTVDLRSEPLQGIVHTIDQLSASFERISVAIDVIGGSPFQGNILGLGAAVEAARSAEQRRGFAMVSSENRGLTRRYATVAEEIQEVTSSSVAVFRSGETVLRATIVQVKEEIRQFFDNVAKSLRIRRAEPLNWTGKSGGRRTDGVTCRSAAPVEQVDRLKEVVSLFKTADMRQFVLRMIISRTNLACF